jgi:hypothetical protein
VEAGEGRHGDSVGELDGAEFEGGEEVRHCCEDELWCLLRREFQWRVGEFSVGCGGDACDGSLTKVLIL